MKKQAAEAGRLVFMVQKHRKRKGRMPVLKTEAKRRPVDKVLVLIMGLLMLFGLLTLFSATFYKGIEKGDALKEVKEQLFGAGVGFAAMSVTMRLPYTFWRKKQVLYMAVGGSLLLLLLVEHRVKVA